MNAARPLQRALRLICAIALKLSLATLTGLIVVSLGVFLQAGAQAKTITVDGNISDWSDVPAVATDPAGDFVDSACGFDTNHRDVVSIKVTSDGGNLYYLLQFGRYCYPYNGLFLFFDTDSNASTGACPTGGIGADMRLSLDPTYTTLHRHCGVPQFPGDDLASTGYGSVWNNTDPNTTYLEGAIPLGYFPNGTATTGFTLQSSPDELSTPAFVSLIAGPQVACLNAPSLITTDQSADYPNLATGGLYAATISNQRREAATGALLADVTFSPNPITSNAALGVYARVLGEGIPFPLQICYLENQSGCRAWGGASPGVTTALTDAIGGDFVSPTNYPTYTVRWCASGSQAFVFARTTMATGFLLFKAMQDVLLGLFPGSTAVQSATTAIDFWNLILAIPEGRTLAEDLFVVFNTGASIGDRLTAAAKLKQDFNVIYANVGDIFFEALYTHAITLSPSATRQFSKATFLKLVTQTLSALDLAQLGLAAGFLDVNVGFTPPIVTIYAQ